MNVYATPFTREPLEATAASADTGMTTLDQVVEMMGPNYRSKSAGCVVYGDGNERVAFTHYLLRVDPESNDG